MSSTFITTIAIVAFLLLAFITVIPLFENYKKYSLFKKIYITIAVVLLFLIGCLDVYIKTSDPSETEKVLQAINKIERIVGMNVNSRTPKIDTEKHVPVIINPLPVKRNLLFAHLRIHHVSLSKTDKPDSILANYDILNDGNSKAFKIRISTMVLTIIDGKYIVLARKTKDKYDPNFSIYSGEKNEQPGTTSLLLAGLKDSSYFCYKIDFKDSSKTNKAFTQLWSISKDHQYLNEIPDSMHKEIEEFLINKRHWLPPFKQ